MREPTTLQDVLQDAGLTFADVSVHLSPDSGNGWLAEYLYERQEVHVYNCLTITTDRMLRLVRHELEHVRQYLLDPELPEIHHACATVAGKYNLMPLEREANRAMLKGATNLQGWEYCLGFQKFPPIPLENLRAESLRWLKDNRA